METKIYVLTHCYDNGEVGEYRMTYHDEFYYSTLNKAKQAYYDKLLEAQYGIYYVNEVTLDTQESTEVFKSDDFGSWDPWGDYFEEQIEGEIKEAETEAYWRDYNLAIKEVENTTVPDADKYELEEIAELARHEEEESETAMQEWLTTDHGNGHTSTMYDYCSLLALGASLNRLEQYMKIGVAEFNGYNASQCRQLVVCNKYLTVVKCWGHDIAVFDLNDHIEAVIIDGTYDENWGFSIPINTSVGSRIYNKLTRVHYIDLI